MDKTKQIQVEVNQNQDQNPNVQSDKMRNLVLSLLFDAIGMLTFTIPFVGEFGDVVWAPLSGLILAKMYPGRNGKIFGGFAFLEEILPFTDVIPTFTISWFYTYILKK